MKWNIGCTGFGYKEWKGVFYPDKMAEHKWFIFYTSQFNTVKINETFLKFPTEEKLLNWYIKTPENFLFASKVPKFITHFKQLFDVEGLLADFYTTCKQGLKEKLGPFLFLFPPKFNFTTERLEQLIWILIAALSMWWNFATGAGGMRKFIHNLPNIKSYFVAAVIQAFPMILW